jgi:hypothetical protein
MALGGGVSTRGARDARAVVRRVQLALAAIVVGQAVLFGAAIGVVLGALAGVIVGVVSGVALGAIVVWRSRTVASLQRAALWVEERDPALQYTLVTAVDPRYPGRAAPTYSGPLLRSAAVRTLWVALAVACVALKVSQMLAGHRIVVGRAHASGAHAGAGAHVVANRLVPLVAHVVPPAYSHLPSRDVREPTTVASLVGSSIVLRGHGDTTGIRVVVGAAAASAAVVSDGGGWRAAFAMPDKPGLVRLSDGAHERLVVLAPIVDQPPTVELTSPVRDSVMREAHGALPLAARASDDIGLASGEFEIIVSSGTEDDGGVHGQVLTVGRVAFGDVRTGQLTGLFPLDSLKPGEIVSIRAVVRDGNAVGGPGVGTSETRTFRVATKQEYDSIAVEGAPPPGVDSSYMSQRMIVMKTQALLVRMRRRPPVVRDTVVSVSRKLGFQEDQLKNKVDRILRGGDRGEGEAMSAPERVLFDTTLAAMTDASMSLAIAEVQEALPRELVALAALDTIRMMQHRLYLRGQPPVIVVNLARVRLTGTSKPEAGVRAGQVATDSVRQRLVLALGRIVGGSQSLDRPGVADSLTLLQVDALGIDPALAGALGDAASAVRGHVDPRPALVRARRLVSGGTSVDSEPVAWGGGGQ